MLKTALQRGLQPVFPGLLLDAVRPVTQCQTDTAAPMQPIKGTGCILLCKISTLEPLDSLHFCHVMSMPTTGNRINPDPAAVLPIL